MIFDDKFSPENGGDSLKGVLGSALVDAGGGGHRQSIDLNADRVTFLR